MARPCGTRAWWGLSERLGKFARLLELACPAERLPRAVLACLSGLLSLVERPLPAELASRARFTRLFELAHPVERLPRAVFACLSGFLSLVERPLPADWRERLEWRARLNFCVRRRRSL